MPNGGETPRRDRALGTMGRIVVRGGGRRRGVGGNGGMSLLERAGEGLARRMNRRKVVRRAAGAIFGTVAAWSVKGLRGSAQLADYCTYVEQGECHEAWWR